MNYCSGQTASYDNKQCKPNYNVAIVSGLRDTTFFVSSYGCLDCKFCACRPGIGNNSQSMFTNGQGFQIRNFQRNNGATFLNRVIGSINIFAVYSDFYKAIKVRI